MEQGDFKVVVSLEAVGSVATATLRRVEERFPISDPNAWVNARETFESVITALNTLEGFSE